MGHPFALTTIKDLVVLMIHFTITNFTINVLKIIQLDLHIKIITCKKIINVITRHGCTPGQETGDWRGPSTGWLLSLTQRKLDKT